MIKKSEFDSVEKLEKYMVMPLIMSSQFQIVSESYTMVHQQE